MVVSKDNHEHGIMDFREMDTEKYIERRGIMFILSSPSGAGKSTIARQLLAREKNLENSVSVTTRKRRGSEIDGVHYHFISEREFRRMRDSGSLLEWAKVHGNFYGTPSDPVEEAMDEGKDVLFDIDWQGGLQLMEKVRVDVASVFIMPPSMWELKNRLERRAEDTTEIISRRLENAVNEISHWRNYDYIVVNRDLELAFAEVSSILQAERLRRDRRPGLFDFVETLIMHMHKDDKPEYL